MLSRVICVGDLLRQLQQLPQLLRENSNLILSGLSSTKRCTASSSALGRTNHVVVCPRSDGEASTTFISPRNDGVLGDILGQSLVRAAVLVAVQYSSSLHRKCGGLPVIILNTASLHIFEYWVHKYYTRTALKS